MAGDPNVPRLRRHAQAHPHTWPALHPLAVEGRPGAEAAERLGMKGATVFVDRSKVQKVLQEEVCKLEGRDPERRERGP